jgi:hypothetical protein|tara:strand:+ start:7672 stop:8352 length:681 start_codon:yes stop_codon:yes gene_type:complete
MNTIGILGNIGSGKNTVAQYFATKGCIPTSFAGPIKDLCTSVFGWDRDLLEGETDESREFRESIDLYWSNKLNISGFTPRLALQLIGTDVMRDHFNQDIWLNSLEYRVKKLHNQNECVVISDVRFRNELELISRVGGTTILVQRNEKPEWYDIALAANGGDAVAKHIMSRDFKDVHSSEYDWIGCKIDFTIDNNGSLEELYAIVDEIIEKLPEKPQIFSEPGLELV